MKCAHHSNGRCVKGLFGGAPSSGTCMICDQYEGPPRGVGDVIHSMANALRISELAGDCGGCAQRRAALNAALTFTDEAPKEG